MEKSKKKAEVKKATKATKKVETKKTVKKVETAPKKKGNKQLKTTIMGLAMMIAAIGLGVGSYAYYQSTLTGTVSGSIRAWSFLVNESPTTFTAQLGNLYPGASGQIDLDLSAEASGLDVEAVVSFSGLSNWPANLHLYKNAGHSELITVGTTTITKTITAGHSDTVTIYYDWPYGTSVEDGPSSNQSASFNITVVGTQVERTYSN